MRVRLPCRQRPRPGRTPADFRQPGLRALRGSRAGRAHSRQGRLGAHEGVRQRYRGQLSRDPAPAAAQVLLSGAERGRGDRDEGSISAAVWRGNAGRLPRRPSRASGSPVGALLRRLFRPGRRAPYRHHGQRDQRVVSPRRHHPQYAANDSQRIRAGANSALHAAVPPEASRADRDGRHEPATQLRVRDEDAVFLRAGNRSTTFPAIVEYQFLTRSELSNGVQLANLPACSVYRAFKYEDLGYPCFERGLANFCRRQGTALDGLKVWPDRSSLCAPATGAWDSCQQQSSQRRVGDVRLREPHRAHQGHPMM